MEFFICGIVIFLFGGLETRTGDLSVGSVNEAAYPAGLFAFASNRSAISIHRLRCKETVVPLELVAETLVNVLASTVEHRTKPLSLVAKGVYAIFQAFRIGQTKKHKIQCGRRRSSAAVFKAIRYVK
jgi:hypothetical protein